jgi:hypothetical protein
MSETFRIICSSVTDPTATRQVHEVGTDDLPVDLQARVALLGGSLLMAFSVVLSWVHVRPLGDLSLVEMIPAARVLGVNNGQLLPWITLALAGMAALIACAAVRHLVEAQLAIGAASVTWVAFLFRDLHHLSAGTLGIPSVGLGPWVALVGAVAMLGSGLAAIRRRSSRAVAQ